MSRCSRNVCNHGKHTHAHTHVHYTAMKYKWVSAGPKTQCDTAAGEAFLASSPGKGSSLETCKAKCKDTPKCASITFNKNGWCSHYSTPCSKTKWNGKTEAYRLTIDGKDKKPVDDKDKKPDGDKDKKPDGDKDKKPDGDKDKKPDDDKDKKPDDDKPGDDSRL